MSETLIIEELGKGSGNNPCPKLRALNKSMLNGLQVDVCICPIGDVLRVASLKGCLQKKEALTRRIDFL